MNTKSPEKPSTSRCNTATSTIQSRSSNPIEETEGGIDSNECDNHPNDIVYARKRAAKTDSPTNLGPKKRLCMMTTMLSDGNSNAPLKDGARIDDVEKRGEGENGDGVVVVVIDDDDDDSGFSLDKKSPVCNDKDGRKRGSLWCHQCKRNNKGRVVRCTMCTSKQFCIPCIKNRYPLLKEEDIARACPVCLNKCNCMACLRSRGNVSSKACSKGKMYSFTSRLSLLPSPKECIGKEQMTETWDISSQQYTSVKEVRVDEVIAEKQLTKSPLPILVRSSNQQGSTQTSEVGPSHTSLNSIQSLFNLPMEEWVKESIIKGVKTIIDIISNYDSTKSLLADQARISQSLTIITSIINSACLRTSEVSWLSAKIKDVISAAEVVEKMETLVDRKQLKALLSEQANCTSEVSGLRVLLSEMSFKSLELKQEENELLKEEARIRQMRESFLAKKKKLVQEISEVSFSLDEKAKEKERLDLRLDELGIKDVEKENVRLKNLINDVISFSKL